MAVFRSRADVPIHVSALITSCPDFDTGVIDIVVMGRCQRRLGVTSLEFAKRVRHARLQTPAQIGSPLFAVRCKPQIAGQLRCSKRESGAAVGWLLQTAILGFRGTATCFDKGLVKLRRSVALSVKLFQVVEELQRSGNQLAWKQHEFRLESPAGAGRSRLDPPQELRGKRHA